MSNLITRTITGILFVTVIIVCISWNAYSCLALFFLITVLGLWEFYTLIEKAGIKPQKILGIVIGIISFLGVSTNFAISIIPNIDGILMDFYSRKFILISCSFILILFIIELFLKSEKPFENIAYTLLGLVYISIPFSFIPPLAQLPLCAYDSIYNPQILLGYFFLVWTNDTGAYIVGSKFGKHKLFERISPKKTWEGSIGGAVFSIVLAVILSNYYTQLSLMNWIVVALIVVVFGTLGDLVESMFKRSLNIKDSGSILPGHGGILDRFDAVLLSAPFVFFYLFLISSF